MSDELTFAEALDVLARANAFGINPSLEGVTELVEALGRPQDTFASVQITGTNGKTSTARIAAALLLAEGRSVGLFTSPELERYPERIEIGGEVVSDADFALAVSAVVAVAEELRGAGTVGTPEGHTEFELFTAAALWLFRERGVEIAVLEVGLGGRWDATSVVSPSVAVITGVGLDHTAILGDTVEQIAADKAAIIKPASTPVLGPGTDGLDAIFLLQAELVGTHPRAVREGLDVSPVAGDLTVRFRVTGRPERPHATTELEVDGVHAHYGSLEMVAPSYQAANVATAVAAAEAALGRALDADRVRAALKSLAIPGRFELVSADPPVIVDGSHNPQAAAVLAAAIREAFPGRKPHVLLGVLADKDARGIVEALAPVASGFSVVRPRSPRALSQDDLAAIVRQVSGTMPQGFPTVPEALETLRGVCADGLVVTGSLTTAGEARGVLLDASATGDE